MRLPISLPVTIFYHFRAELVTGRKYPFFAIFTYPSLIYIHTYVDKENSDSAKNQ